jgi:hypothetical protein
MNVKLGLGSGPFSIHDLSSIFNKSNTTGATCGSGTAYPSEHQSSLPVSSGVRFT